MCVLGEAIVGQNWCFFTQCVNVIIVIIILIIIVIIIIRIMITTTRQQESFSADWRRGIRTKNSSFWRLLVRWAIDQFIIISIIIMILKGVRRQCLRLARNRKGGKIYSKKSTSSLNSAFQHFTIILIGYNSLKINMIKI